MGIPCFRSATGRRVRLLIGKYGFESHRKHQFTGRHVPRGREGFANHLCRVRFPSDPPVYVPLAQRQSGRLTSGRTGFRNSQGIPFFLCKLFLDRVIFTDEELYKLHDMQLYGQIRFTRTGPWWCYVIFFNIRKSFRPHRRRSRWVFCYEKRRKVLLVSGEPGVHGRLLICRRQVRVL